MLHWYLEHSAGLTVSVFLTIESVITVTQKCANSSRTFILDKSLSNITLLTLFYKVGSMEANRSLSLQSSCLYCLSQGLFFSTLRHHILKYMWCAF